MYNTKNEPYSKLWTLSDYDVSKKKVILVKKKCTILVNDVDNGGAYAYVGRGYMGNLYLLNFVINLELL